MIRKNWAGNVDFNPQAITYPKSEEEIQHIVLKAAQDCRKIRTIGSGHSFTELCTTNDILLSLDNYQGLVAVDKEKLQATVRGGTKLKSLGEILFKEGLAMENLGDIDAQSIAGTISTGTHGTGVKFGTISTQVIAIKLITAAGQVISCSPSLNPDLFKAAQVSLGAFGIITEVTIQCVPSYKLMIQNGQEPLEEVLSSLDDRNSQNRNFEFYWMPYTQSTWTKTTNIVEEGEPQKDSLMNYLSELIVENYSFKAMCELATIFPSLNKTVSKITARTVPRMNKINFSHRVYATMRIVKFTEMEYNIPAESFKEVMSEVRKTVNSGEFPIHFPIENRWVKQDDIFMSPAYGRDSAYIACHAYYKKDSQKYFKRLEDIFKAHGGRPHWGKMHTLGRQDIEERYPKFTAFNALRKKYDPDNLFLNRYLEKLFN